MDEVIGSVVQQQVPDPFAWMKQAIETDPVAAQRVRETLLGVPQSQPPSQQVAKPLVDQLREELANVQANAPASLEEAVARAGANPQAQQQAVTDFMGTQTKITALNTKLVEALHSDAQSYRLQQESVVRLPQVIKDLGPVYQPLLEPAKLQGFQGYLETRRDITPAMRLNPAVMQEVAGNYLLKLNSNLASSVPSLLGSQGSPPSQVGSAFKPTQEQVQAAQWGGFDVSKFDPTYSAQATWGPKANLTMEQKRMRVP